MKLGKKGLALGFVAGLVLAPAAAVAATGVFSSGNTTPALTAKNTSTGLAIDASTANGTSFRSTSGGTGNGFALFLRQNATGNLSNGLYAHAYPKTGEHYGAWGIIDTNQGAGVRGQSTSGDGLGVLGTAGLNGGVGAWGSGSFGVVGQSDGSGAGVYSFGDVYVDGSVAGAKVLTNDDGVAGTCDVVSGTGACAFTNPFPFGTPIVVVTPLANPGGPFWVDSVTADGFSIHTEASASLTFNYVVVGFDNGGAASKIQAKAQSLRTRVHR